MNPSRILMMSAGLCVCAVAGDAKSTIPASGDWEISLAVGQGYRAAGSMNFSGGSNGASLPLASFVGADSLVVPPIGDAGSYDERSYDDGFVRQDASTGIDGFTGYWGYQNSTQADVPGDAIRFHATGLQSIVSQGNAFGTGGAAKERMDGPSPVLHFEARHRRSEVLGARPGVSATLSWTPVDFDRRWSDYAQSQLREDYRIDWTDTYNLGGVGQFLPGAPYAGTFLGPGFLLENIPDSRTSVATLVGTESAMIGNDVTARFRGDHTTFSFGPTLTWATAPNWRVQTAAGVSVHWVHWSASQSEQVSVDQGGVIQELGSWKDSSSGDRLLGGLYLQVMAEWMPDGKPWSIKGMVRGDLGQSFRGRVGPSRFEYDTDGLTAALMVSRSL